MDKLKAYIQVCRPQQYLKNGFIWLPILFGNQLLNRESLISTIIAFLAFCLISSTTYVINDTKDIENDRRHPTKKKRPLASGAISKIDAAVIALVLFIGSLSITLKWLPVGCAFLIMAYLLLNIVYSLGLKRVPIVDIVCIAIGFVLRVFTGGMATQIPISPWIVIMTFLLALFLALAKRRDDLLLAEQGNQVRKAIDGYSLEFISLAMAMMASVIIVSYILYTVSPEVMAKHNTGKLYISSIWVLLGLLRYLQITFVEEKSGSPTLVLIKDHLLQVVIVLWLANIILLLYP